MKFRVVAVMTAMFFCASMQAFGGINNWTAIGPSGGTVNKSLS